jgi:hypothetical protein
MQRRIGIVIAALALAIAIPATALAARSTTPFAGTWTSTDFDDSTQVLIIAGGGHPSVVYEDFFASGCYYNAGPATHWVAAGQGSIDGDTIWIDYHKSGCGTFLQGGYGDYYTYNSGDDTLTDSVGITWYRMT